MAAEAHAQWSLGVKGGWNSTSETRSSGGRIDESYSSLDGYDAGITAKCELTDWMGIRADLDLMQRSHRMDRNLHYIDPVYTEYRNTYLMLPVMADFSFGGERLRGHLLCGGFAGYWLKADVKGTTYWMTDYYVYFNDFDEAHAFTSEDQRLTAGLVGGVGLSYDLAQSWRIALDALYYYDLVSNHKDYPHLADPRYLNTLSCTLGVSYLF